MASFFQLVVPEQGQNILLNPSFELGTTGYVGGNSAVISRNTSRARQGAACLQVTMPAGAGVGPYYVTPVLAASTAYTFSCDFTTFNDNGAGVPYLLQIQKPDTTLLTTLAFTGPTGWARPVVTFTTTVSGAYTLSVIRASGSNLTTIYTDGWQLTQTAYEQTYIDGDQYGCSWLGAPHASQSVRSAQWRGGGRVYDFADLGFDVLDYMGTGMPHPKHVSTPFGLGDGSLWQRTGVDQRVFTLRCYVQGISGLTGATGLTTKRATMINALRKDLVTPEQPIRIRSTESGRTWEIQCHYDDGLGRGVTEGVSDETIPLRFIADDPFWYSVGTNAQSLSVNETVADADYILQRDTTGVWASLNGGLNGTVNAVLYDAAGNLYVGGAFTTAYNAAGTGSPVTVNHIALWTQGVTPGSGTWSALGSGVNNTVNALAFDAAGNLYVGGAFTNAAYPYLARWDGSTFTPVYNAVGQTGTVLSLAYSAAQNLLLAGGTFLSWAGYTNYNAFAAYDFGTAAWVFPGTTAYPNLVGASMAANSVNAIVVNQNGTITIGGSFASAPDSTVVQNVAAYTPGAGAWRAIGTGLGLTYGSDYPFALAIDQAGAVYAGGNFVSSPQFMAKATSGNAWQALGTGVNSLVSALAVDSYNRLYVGGLFTTAGGLAAKGIATWTGSAWSPTWLTLPGTVTVNAFAFRRSTTPNSPTTPYEQIVIGFNTTGSAVASNVTTTTITNAGSAAVAPQIILTGPGIVESIANTTTGKELFFNLTLQAGERAVLDLTRGAPTFASTLGRPNMLSTILPQSDLSWQLQGGANTVLVKFGGTTTGATSVSFVWADKSYSNDAP